MITFNNGKIYPQKQSTYRSNNVDTTFSIPALPLLGQLTSKQTADKVLKAITDEATTIEFYTRLLKDSTTDLQKTYIADAINEETKHLKMFTELYQFLTGVMPVYTITPITYTSYKDGILKALNGELDAIDFYKQMTLSTSYDLIIQSFNFALFDEIAHSVMFSTIYSQL